MTNKWILRVGLVAYMAVICPLLQMTDALGASASKVDQLSELQRDVAVIKETSALRLDAQKESLQKDVQNIQSKIDQQDKRISDINTSITFFSVLITLLAAGAGVAAWYSAGTKAREAAQEWIRDHKSELMADARKAVGEIQEETVKHKRTIQEKEDEFSAICDQAKRRLEERLTSSTASVPTLSLADKRVLEVQEDRLKRKPESDYTFSDWESRAFTAYAAKQFDVAANFFLEASKSSGASPIQIARSLFARAVMLGELNRYTEAVSSYEEVIKRYGEAMELVLREQVVIAMVNKGVALARLNRNEEAIVVHEEVIKRYKDATELVLREQVAMALVNKGLELGQLNRSEEAIQEYNQVLSRYKDSVEPAMQILVAKAMMIKGDLLCQLKRNEEAIGVFEEVINRYKETAEIALSEQVAMAMVGKGVALGRLSRYEDMIGVCDQVVAQYGNVGEPALQVQVAMAMFNKSVTLGRLNRLEEAIGVYDQVIDRYGESAQLVLQTHVAKMMAHKGSALARINRMDQAMAMYDEVIKRYGGRTESALNEPVANAINGLGFSMLLKAKMDWQKDGVRMQFLKDAELKFRSSLERYPQNSFAIGNLSYVYFLQGQRLKVIEPLRQALALGGEDLYQATVKDTETYPVPDDADFRELLEKTWSEVRAKKNL